MAASDLESDLATARAEVARLQAERDAAQTKLTELQNGMKFLGAAAEHVGPIDRKAAEREKARADEWLRQCDELQRQLREERAAHDAALAENRNFFRANGTPTISRCSRTS